MLRILTTRLLVLVLFGLVWTPAAYAWSWPVQGPVLQQFAFDPAHPYATGQHRGIDIGAATGSQVLAPAAGTVTFAGTVPTSGHCVTIETADGYSVTLTQLGALLVARGATVAEGDAVAAVGSSGTPELEVPYVHLGIRVATDPNGYVDPLSLLPALPPPAPPDAVSPPAAASQAPATSPAPVASSAPATSPEPPVAASPAAAPAPTTIVETPVSAATVVASTAPVAALDVTAPVVRVLRTTARRPVRRPTTHGSQQSRPVPAHVRRAPVEEAAAIPSGVGRRARAGSGTPHSAAATPAPVRHRPVSVPASPRELQAIEARPTPALPLALCAGVAALAAAGLLVMLRLRRRRPAAPGTEAVVIPLPRRPDRFAERRAA